LQEAPPFNVWSCFGSLSCIVVFCHVPILLDYLTVGKSWLVFVCEHE